MSLGLGLSDYVPIAVYVMGVLALIATLFYKREYGLYYLIPLIPAIVVREKLKAFPLGKDVVDIFVLALLVSIVLSPGEKRRPDPTLNWMVVIMVVMAYLGLWIGSFKLGLAYPTLSEERFLEWKNFVIMPILYFIVLRTVTNKKQMWAIVALMAVTVLFMNRYWYSTYRFYKSYHFDYSQRISAGFSYLGENELAAFFAMTMLFMLGLMLCLKKWHIKGALAAGIAANTYCILYLFSRGAYMAVAAGLMLYGILLDRRILLGLIILFLAWQFILPQSVIDRIDMSETDEGTDPSIQGRLDMWAQALENIMANPLIGSGYGSTGYLGFGSGSRETRRDVHNGYLELLMESGVIGTICFLVVFYRGGMKGLRLFRTAKDPFLRGLGIGLVGMIVASLATNVTSETWHYLAVTGYFWVLLAMVVIAQDLAATEQKAEAESSPEQKPAEQAAG
jgi:O-antigen ligase